MGLAASGGAVLVAAWLLFRDYLPAGLSRGVDAALKPPFAWLESWHSGQVCDYAAWLGVGMAGLGILFYLALRA